jgi:hypothetical protein
MEPCGNATRSISKQLINYSDLRSSTHSREKAREPVVPGPKKLNTFENDQLYRMEILKLLLYFALYRVLWILTRKV